VATCSTKMHFLSEREYFKHSGSLRKRQLVVFRFSIPSVALNQVNRYTYTNLTVWNESISRPGVVRWLTDFVAGDSVCITANYLVGLPGRPMDDFQRVTYVREACAAIS